MYKEPRYCERGLLHKGRHRNRLSQELTSLLFKRAEISFESVDSRFN